MALSELQVVAWKHEVRLLNQLGDLVYINNWSVLHARDAYQDAETSSRYFVCRCLRNKALGSPSQIPCGIAGSLPFGEKTKAVLHGRYTTGSDALLHRGSSRFTKWNYCVCPDDKEPESKTENQ
jgi:hypothetical protein